MNYLSLSTMTETQIFNSWAPLSCGVPKSMSLIACLYQEFGLVQPEKGNLSLLPLTSWLLVLPITLLPSTATGSPKRKYAWILVLTLMVGRNVYKSWSQGQGGGGGSLGWQVTPGTTALGLAEPSPTCLLHCVWGLGADNCMEKLQGCTNCKEKPFALLLKHLFLQFTFNFILYWFQVYSLVVRQSYTLHSVSINISSAHPALHIIITILLTVFPMLYWHPHDYFVTTNLYCLTPSPLSPRAPTLSSLATTSQLSVSRSLFQLCSFLLLFRFHT